MKILWKDLSKLPATTIDSLYGVNAYPASNVAHPFLNKWFISTLQNDTVTIDYTTSYALDAVYVAGCNCAKFDLQIVSSTGTILYAQTGIPNNREITAVYLSQEVQARYVKVTADIQADGLAPFIDPLLDSGANLKIKGIGTGCACVLPDPINDFSLPRAINTRYASSVSGQYLASQYPPLREREWKFKGATEEHVSTIEDGILQLGYFNPTYIDVFDTVLQNTETTVDPPAHMVLVDTAKPVRTGTTYELTLKFKEAR